MIFLAVHMSLTERKEEKGEVTEAGRKEKRKGRKKMALFLKVQWLCIIKFNV